MSMRIVVTCDICGVRREVESEYHTIQNAERDARKAGWQKITIEGDLTQTNWRCPKHVYRPEGEYPHA